MKKTANEKSHTADNSLALSFRTKKPLRSECSGKVQGTQSAWNEREKKKINRWEKYKKEQSPIAISTE
jgi:hypothetical protein